MLKQMRSLWLVAMLLIVATTIRAQVTTASMSGKVTEMKGEPFIGATIQAIHEPSGTRYGTISNPDGRYAISGMRVGGPYRVEISYIGYQKVIFKDIQLQLGDNYVLNAYLKESAELLDEVVVSATKSSNMKSDRAGAVTNVTAQQIAAIPTVNRTMNDVMRLTPQGGNTTGGGFAVGGGNYRQSYVTVDGAAFNNAFGIGSNLPGNGSPISLDALDQISVSVTPYDVRQSGFTGGAINATTKSGTNNFYASVYSYLTNVHLRGNKVDDYELIRNRDHSSTFGTSIGGALVKDKLFFFLNGEYEDNVSAGPSGIAQNDETGPWATSGIVHRPTEVQMNTMQDFLIKNYNYNPGRYQGYSLETPAYRIMGRLDWNINENNRVNFRFSKTHTKDSNSPSSSTTPFKDNIIYPGSVDDGISSGRYNSGRTSNTALYFESARYMQERNFTSLAAEWNSKFNIFNNALRLTYSYQNEPRTYVGGVFPTVDILEKGAVYTTFGPDPFTAGNIREVKTFVATDELTFNVGKHNFIAGLQFEHNNALNGFMPAGNSYYVYSSWDDFATNKAPAAFGVTYSAAADGKQFEAKMKYQQMSMYMQDQMTVNDNLKLTAGLRFELPIYPKLENNYNEEFAKIDFNGQKYSTDQLPKSSITISPRIGFNWDLTGERKYVLRGGTGYFVGRLPFVWLVSAVSNSNCGQILYYYNTPSDATLGTPSKFYTSVSDLFTDSSLNLKKGQDGVTVPSTPTIIDKNLKMPAMWKSSLAFDAKLPGDIDFSFEGIYGKDINPAVVRNEGYSYDGSKEIKLNDNDVRRSYTRHSSKVNAYLITNGGNDAYYYSLTASLAKKFNFGLNLYGAYTYSNAKSYGDGIGDQVGSAYYTNRFSVNGINEEETGYGTYVTPHRLIASATYRKEYAGAFASSISFIYEGMNMGYSGGYSSTRYSYTFTKNIVNDYGANNLIYVPGSREELDKWNFADAGTYTANAQRDDFWNYINQDNYLKGRKGKYAERGGAVMPWHHQLDMKFMQDFYILDMKGKRNTLQFGIDIKNVLNLLNSSWGIYKSVNNTSLLSYDTKTSAYNFQKNGQELLKNTYTNYKGFGSTYSIQFSIRYIFH